MHGQDNTASDGGPPLILTCRHTADRARDFMASDSSVPGMYARVYFAVHVSAADKWYYTVATGRGQIEAGYRVTRMEAVRAAEAAWVRWRDRKT